MWGLNLLLVQHLTRARCDSNPLPLPGVDDALHAQYGGEQDHQQGRHQLPVVGQGLAGGFIRVVSAAVRHPVAETGAERGVRQEGVGAGEVGGRDVPQSDR